MTCKEYRRAAEIVANLKHDSLQQAQVYRAFCNFFQPEENFNQSKFDSACDIADPIAGLRPAKRIKPPKGVHV